jgi:hypothetical protein
MKNILGIVLWLTILSGCKELTKIELPYTGNPARITYVREIKATEVRDVNYENLMKGIFILSPNAKIVLEDKYNGNFQVVGYSPYVYKGGERRFSYMLTCNFTNERAEIIINRIHILHTPLEEFYFSKRRRHIKKLNPSYEDINKKCLAFMDDLSSRVK